MSEGPAGTLTIFPKPTGQQMARNMLISVLIYLAIALCIACLAYLAAHQAANGSWCETGYCDADTAAAMLAKAGVDVAALECGAHWPYHDAAVKAMAAAGAQPTALNNNCSGKHAGFVCLGCLLADLQLAWLLAKDSP
jgi:hypothetical protein